MATSTTAGTPAAPTGNNSGGDSNLAYLKSLVGQLQSKIEALEAQASKSTQQAGQALSDAVSSVKESTGLTPAQRLRIVLMGPPGSG